MPWEKRATPTGFLQFRERYDDGKAGRWQFQIYGFSGGPPGYETECSVCAVDGKRTVSIDARSRILIEGRRYGRNYWNH